MTTFILTAVFIGLMMAIMAVGVLFGRGPIKGSCGGMGALGFDTACDICGGNPSLCEEENRDSKPAPADKAQFYSADR